MCLCVVRVDIIYVGNSAHGTINELTNFSFSHDEMTVLAGDARDVVIV